MECSPLAAIAITTSPGRTRPGPSSVVGLDHAGGGAGDVVLVGLEQPGVLRGLAADERAAGLDARLGDALDDRRDPLGHDLAGRDVVGHEQRLGAADHQVVDHHADQVEADRVVLVHHLRHGDLGADAVGRRRQQRPLVRRQRARVEQAGEPAEPAHHLRAPRLLDPGLHQVDGLVGGVDVDAGAGVGVVGVGQGANPYGLLNTGKASPWIGDVSVASRRCLPRRLSSGSGIGYSPVKQAVHRLSCGCPVASIIPSSEM